MCLTGRMMGAEEAERAGLVAKVVPAADLLDEALKTAEAIAAMAPLAAIATKEMVNAAFEMPPGAGHQLRAPPVPRPVRHRGPEGRHGRLRRKAPGQLDGQVRSTDMARVAFIGLGNMGGGMAANLAKAGHEVLAFDLSAGRARPRQGQWLQRSPTAPRPRSPDAEAVVTMLPAGKHVAEVYRSNVLLNAPEDRDPDRLLDDRRRHRQGGRSRGAGRGLHDGRRAGVGRDRRGRGRDADLHGRRQSDDGFERAKPFLEKMGKAVIHAGGPGAGQAAKICNNMLLGATMAATCEAFVLAREARARPAEPSSTFRPRPRARAGR